VYILHFPLKAQNKQAENDCMAVILRRGKLLLVGNKRDGQSYICCKTICELEPLGMR
jgi:hypothetical protein